jgi:mannan endo-1,4-beta-mannosidase
VRIVNKLLPWIVSLQLCSAIFSCQNPPVQAAAPANVKASAKTVDVLNYLTNLKNSSSNKVLSGQHISHDGGDVTTGYKNFIENLKTRTGKYPAIVGTGMTASNLSGAVSTLTNAWNAGSLVQVDAHFDNPWIADDAFVSNENSAKPNLLSLIPGDPAFNPTAYSKWKSELDNTASALKQLQNAGVTVLWRPLHEMNGTWFWWGQDQTNPNNTDPYKKLWQSMFDYYTNTWGLNNLLWVYSTSPSWVNSVTAYYPGSNYVDIVGMDIYSDTLAPYRASDYTDLKRLGKPMAMTESGPSRRDGFWDTTTIPKAIRSYYPDFSYFLQWPSWKNSNGSTAKVALQDNLNATSLLKDPWVVTRDEVKVPTTTLAPQSFLPSAFKATSFAPTSLSLAGLELNSTSDNSSPSSVPEPSSVMGLLMLGVLATGKAAKFFK